VWSEPLVGSQDGKDGRERLLDHHAEHGIKVGFEVRGIGSCYTVDEIRFGAKWAIEELRTLSQRKINYSAVRRQDEGRNECGHNKKLHREKRFSKGEW
jgi:hypothetical protein